MDPSLISWVGQIEKIGPYGMLILVILGGFKRWWVWGHQLVDLRSDFQVQLAASEARGEQWRQLALNGAGLTERAVDLAARGKS